MGAATQPTLPANSHARPRAAYTKHQGSAGQSTPGSRKPNPWMSAVMNPPHVISSGVWALEDPTPCLRLLCC